MHMETKLKKFGTLFIDDKPYQTSDIIAPTELDGRKVEIGDTVPGFEIEWVENHGIYVPRMPLCCQVSYQDLWYMSGKDGIRVSIDHDLYEMRLPTLGYPQKPSTDDRWFEAVKADVEDVWLMDGMKIWAEQEPEEDPFHCRNVVLFTLGLRDRRCPEIRRVGSKDMRAANIGWRPMLECISLDPEQLVHGTPLRVFFGSHTSAYGKLGDVTLYDIVLEELYSISQYDPAGSFIDRKTVIIDRSSIQYLRYDRGE